VKGGYTEIVSLLLEKGANVNETQWGRAPLHYAAKEGHKEVVSLLLDRGAYIKAKDMMVLSSLIIHLLLHRHSC
jgi:ankyrin repeat protein